MAPTLFKGALVLLGLRCVAAVSAVATATGPDTVCTTIAPTCSASPVKDPSFELNDGSWTFNGGGIVAASPNFPARSYTHLAQFVFISPGRGFEAKSSFSQTLSGLCIDSPYTFTGYYSAPSNPEGISCSMTFTSGDTQLGSSDIDFDSTGIYTPITGTFVPASASAVIDISIDCIDLSSFASVWEIDIDDFTLALTNPTPSVSCSTVTPTPTQVPASFSISSAISTSSSASASCSSPTTATCGVESYARTADYFIGVTYSSPTLEACTNDCLADWTCGGLFYSVDYQYCQLFSGAAADSDLPGSKSVYEVYDISCFLPVVSTCSSLSSSTSGFASSSAAQTSSLDITSTIISSSLPASETDEPCSTSDFASSSAAQTSSLDSTSTIISTSLPSSETASFSLSSAMSTTSTSTASSASTSCSIPSTAICGMYSIARTVDYYIPGTYSPTPSLEDCTNFCFADSTCGGVFYSVPYAACILFTGAAAASDEDNETGSTYQVYDIACFCPVSSTSSSSLPSTTSITSQALTTSTSSSVYLNSTTSTSSSCSSTVSAGTSLSHHNATRSHRPSGSFSRITTTSCYNATKPTSVPTGNTTVSTNTTSSHIRPSASISRSMRFPNTTSHHIRPSGSFSLTTRTSCYTNTRSTSLSTIVTSSSIPTILSLSTSSSLGPESMNSIISSTLVSTSSPAESVPISILSSTSLISNNISTILPLSTASSADLGSATSSIPTILPLSTSTSAILGSTTSEISSSFASTFSSVDSVTKFSTSTVYATTVYTITKCPATVTNCPIGSVTTKTIAISTTVCPVTKVATETSVPEGYTTSTVYTTRLETVTKCPATVTNCPVGQVVTKTIALYTTICPIAEAEGTGTKITGSATKSIFLLASITAPATGKTPLPEGYTTSTIYTTQMETITKCPASIANCPVGQVVTKTIAISTTICPIAQAEGTGTKSGASSKTGSSVPAENTGVPAASSINTLSGLNVVPSITISGSLIPTPASSGAVAITSSGTVASSLVSGVAISLATPLASNSPSVSSQAASLTISSASNAASGITASPTTSAEGIVSMSSVGGSATTSSTLAQFTGGSAGREHVGWTGLGVILAAAGLMVL